MPPIDQRADVVRHFNRFYTRRIGALGGAHLDSAFSLTEVRVLYELAHRDRPTASGIASALEIDRGYLSRMLRAFKRRGLITTRRDADDRRHTHLALTAVGRKAFAPLDRRARDEVVADARAARATHASVAWSSAMRDDSRLARTIRAAGPAAGRGTVHAPAAPSGRHGLDRAAPRRAVPRRVWLGRAVRSPRGARRRGLHRALRSSAGTLLDRRAKRRDGRLGLRRREVEARREASTPAGRAVGARARHRKAARRRSHAVRARGRLPKGRALDAKRADRCSPDLLRRGIPLRA